MEGPPFQRWEDSLQKDLQDLAEKESDRFTSSSRQGPVQPCPRGLSDCPQDEFELPRLRGSTNHIWQSTPFLPPRNRHALGPSNSQEHIQTPPGPGKLRLVLALRMETTTP